MEYVNRIEHVPSAVAWCIWGCFLYWRIHFCCRRDSPLRVGVVGMVHGHVAGFLDAAGRRNDMKIVGIAESDTAVAGEYRRRFHLETIETYDQLR